MTKQQTPTTEAYGHAAWLLLCKPAALRAVARVEAGTQGAFDENGAPTILFERHRFDKLTQGRFRDVTLEHVSAEFARISDPRSGGYGPFSVQHRKLALAVTKDRDAAIRACSWGLFQIMGDNHVEAGYPSIQRFVNAMYRHVDDHLRALVMFLRHNEHLVDAIRGQDWPMFAYHYNGPNHAKNDYVGRLTEAYAELRGDA